MAQTKNTTWESQTIIRPGYIEYPLPEGIERKITSGKWGTAIASGNLNSTIRKPASRKKK